MEYENIGPVEDVTQGVGTGGGIDAEAIELLIMFVNFLWDEWYMLPQVMRLHGGGPIKRQRSFRNAPVKPLRKRHWTDGMDIDTPAEMIAWRTLENAPFTGTGHRYVEGLGDSTVSVENFPWRAPPYSPLSLQGQIRDRYFRDIVSERMMQGTAVVVGAGLGTLRITYPGYGGSDDVSSKSRNVIHTRTENILNNEMDGIQMLEWKNKLTRKLKTHYYYNMSVVRCQANQVKSKATAPFYEVANTANHSCFVGAGPCLYTTVIETPLNEGDFAANPPTGKPNRALLEYAPIDSGWFNSEALWKSADDTARKLFRGIGANATVYVFAADWIGGYMNFDFTTQTDYRQYDSAAVLTDPQNPWYKNGRNGNLLLMERVSYDTSTDLNNPVDPIHMFNNFLAWTYLTHYYTVWNFKMRNFSHQNYCVEILVFSFKADVDTFDYNRQCTAVVNRQKDKMQDYYDGISEPPQDIIIIHRKRIYLAGLNNPISGESALNTDNTGMSNKLYKYVHRRKYVIKRPILSSWRTNMTERDTFNDYYEQQTGNYIRMQAWPINAYSVTDINVNMSIRNNEDALLIPDKITDVSNFINCDKLLPGVDVKIDKKSYFKLDETYIK